MFNTFARIALFLVFSLNFYNTQAHSISLICPSVQDISVRKQPYDEFWREYAYSAYIQVALPVVNNELNMVGQGSADQLNGFKLATWTDRTFLCWYHANTEDQVIFTIDLDPYLEKCSFDASKNVPECEGSSPEQCVLSCTVRE